MLFQCKLTKFVTMINQTKLENAVKNIENGLKDQFPQIPMHLEPYYAGMGYCGVEIIVDKNVCNQMIDKIDTFYKEKFLNVFCIHKITKVANKNDEFKPGEVRWVGKDGECFNPL